MTVSRWQSQVTFWRFLLAAMMCLLALVAFWPSPIDAPIHGNLSRLLTFLHERGLPLWFNYPEVEALANVALFIPVGMALALAFPGTSWWVSVTQGLFVSCMMEMGQFLFLHSRHAGPLDVAANTGGALVGVLLIIKLVRKDGR